MKERAQDELTAKRAKLALVDSRMLDEGDVSDTDWDDQVDDENDGRMRGNDSGFVVLWV